MRIKIFAAHPSAQLRMQILKPTLLRHGHFITHESDNADIYILDCMRVCDIPDSIINEVSKFKGEIILTSLGNWSTFNFAMDGKVLPDDIINRAVAFMKIQWSKDPSMYDKRIIGKQICIQPFLIGGIPDPVIDKRPIISFYGLPTGNLDSGKNLRISACRILNKTVHFRGGIVGQEPGVTRDIAGVGISTMPRNMYLRMINNTRLSLCLPGNSALTYRLFESLGMGCTVISTDLDQIQWLNNLIPGVHYIKIADDLSDLMEVCENAVKDLSTTRKIGDEGYQIYKQYYMLNRDNTMQDTMWSDISSQLKRCGVNL